MREKSKKIIIEAGQRLLEVKNLRVEEKTDFRNLVTSYDTATQDFLMEKLSQVAPDATFLCEEKDAQTISDKMFIIDPIDGTANFVHGTGLSAISVAYAEYGKLVWGIVYNPFMDECYEAERGQGAWLNGKPIHVTDLPLKNTLVSVGTSPYNPEFKEETLELMSKVLTVSMDIRRSGSAALDLCYVAAGRYGLYIEKVLQAWDMAAGIVICEEAGGKVINFNLELPDFTKRGDIIAGTQESVETFVELIRG
ncbi:MAG: inositol monophosphatase [Eubacterium sp.]|nr:inositol monophosphatase [Candidatus Colimonas fimequi]